MGLHRVLKNLSYVLLVVALVAASNIQKSPAILSGTIIATGRTTAPDCWVLADGTAISRTTYANLFTAIGTAYGVGDGSTTFNVPDLRQRVPLGKADSGTGSTLGGTGGSIDATATIPAHYHAVDATGADINITASGASNHSNNTNVAILGVSGNGLTSSSPSNFIQFLTQTAQTHTHANGDFSGRVGLVTGGVDGDAEMTSGAINPPFQTVNYMIYYC